MFLKNINLSNYRNYKNCSLAFETNKTLLIGKNAQGKTNLLEAVHYLSLLNTPRAKNDKELILWNEELTQIKGVINKSDVDIDLDVMINPPNKKILKVNGLKRTKNSEYIGNLVVVNFSTDDLLLLRGNPQNRRKWLDNCISKIYPRYSDRLVNFNKIRIQRNNFLKSLKGNIDYSSTEMFDVWDEQLAISSSNIIFLRLKYLKELQEISNSKHKIIAEDENMVLNYNSSSVGKFSTVDQNIPKIDEIMKKLEESIKAKRKEEIIRSQTLVGPHRDDVDFYINEVDSKSYASQGQQRTIVLSLKLAELELIKEKIGEYPLLLLDDVLAELDNHRQNYLLNSIKPEIQTIITSTDTINFKPEFLEDVRIYNIAQGEVVNEV